MAFPGIYRGVVTDVADPENLGRVKALVPQMLGTVQTDWAWPVSPNIINVTPLIIGDPVWIAFEGGELEHPIWLGTWAPVGGVLNTLPDLDAERGARIAVDTAEASTRAAADTAEATARTAADNAEAAARIAGDAALTAGLTVPPGMLMPYAGPTPPTGWLLCNGAEVSKTTYANLWTAIGSAHVYGTPGDPTNNFLLPNLKGKTIVMQDAGQTEFATMGLAGGSKISTAPHTHGLQNHTHSGTSAVPNDNTSDWPNGNASGYVANPQGWQGSTGHVHAQTHGHVGSYIGNVRYMGGAQSHEHAAGGGFTSEQPNPNTGTATAIPLNITGNDVANTSGESGHQHGLENHNHDLQNHTHTMKNHTHTLTTGVPSNNTSDVSSAGAASGNLQPFLTMNYLIKT